VWVGYFLPKGTPQPIVNKLSAIFEKASRTGGEERPGRFRQVVDYQNGAAFAKFIPEERKMLEEVAKKAKMIK